MLHLVVDAANVVGLAPGRLVARPPRRGPAARGPASSPCWSPGPRTSWRLSTGTSPTSAETAGSDLADAAVQVHLVLEGAACDVEDLPTHPLLDVVHAPADGDSRDRRPGRRSSRRPGPGAGGDRGPRAARARPGGGGDGPGGAARRPARAVDAPRPVRRCTPRPAGAHRSPPVQTPARRCTPQPARAHDAGCDRGRPCRAEPRVHTLAGPGTEHRAPRQRRRSRRRSSSPRRGRRSAR